MIFFLVLIFSCALRLCNKLEFSKHMSLMLELGEGTSQMLLRAVLRDPASLAHCQPGSATSSHDLVIIGICTSLPR
jgi:hypothetical protein